MTRSISTWPSADVSCDTSDSDAARSDGCVIFQTLPSFFRVVASPAAVDTFTSSILSACTAAKTFSFLASPAAAPPSGTFEVTK